MSTTSRSVFPVLVFAVLVLCCVPRAQAQTTALYFNSEPGDPIGQGLEQTWTPADLDFTASTFGTPNRLTIWADDFDRKSRDFTWWSLDFYAPAGQALAEGAYVYASRAPFNPPKDPGLSVSGSGRGCDQLAGRFEVHEIEFDANGTLVRFAADFEQHCGDGIPALLGAVRYNSTRATLVPFDGNAPLYRLQAAVEGSGKITGTGISCGLEAVDCDETFSVATEVTLQAVPDEGYVFAGWAQDCAGEASTDVKVSRAKRCTAVFGTIPGGPAGPPTTVLIFDSAPGDYVGQGKRAAWVTDSSAFAGSREGAGVRMTVTGLGGAGNTWVLSFAPPAGKTLLPGTYLYARRAPFAAAPDPGLAIWGSGRSCGELVGRFEIYEIEFDGNGTLLRFAADFEQQCGEGIPALVGALRYNSTRSTLDPFDGNAPLYRLQAGVEGPGEVIAAGIDCGLEAVDCDETFSAVTDLTLQAVPLDGYVFAGWAQDCAGDASTVVRVSRAKRCTAVFGTAPGGPPGWPTTVLVFDSEPGDYIGQGKRAAWITESSTFAGSREGEGLRMTVEGFGIPGERWDLSFAPPAGGALVPGTYPYARRSPFNSPTSPGLDVHGAGRGCNQVVGRFEVYEIVFDGNGVLQRFAADFEQHCEGRSAALRGAIRYNSTRRTFVPFEGERVFSLRLIPPANGTIEGHGLRCGGGHTTCQATFDEAAILTPQLLPNRGYYFAGWTGSCSAQAADIGVYTTLECSANFQPAAPRPLGGWVTNSGYTAPVEMVFLPGSFESVIVEQGGLIKVRSRSTPLLDLRGQISTGGERGLLGVAFPDDFFTSHRFYVSFTNTDGHSVIARFETSDATPLVADPASRFDLKWSNGLRHIPQPFGNHNGGQIRFGPDGMLYIAMGDGGGANDPYHLAQSGNNLLGKILRIDVDVPDGDAEGFDVPADNPFVGRERVHPEIWSFGWRNPWKFTFDDPGRGGTGAMIAGDVGQARWEEINYEPAGAGGRNYGWSNFEGTQPGAAREPLAFGPATPPLFEYDRSMGQSITGGVVYRGSSLGPEYVGRYFFADFMTGRVWSMAIRQGARAEAWDLREHTSEIVVPGGLGNISALAVDNSGEMYIVSYSTGRIIRIEVNFSAPRLPPFVEKEGLATADYNGDGNLDLLWQHDRDGWLAAWYLNGTSIIDSVLTTPAQVSDPTWKIVATPRLNADFHADIVWQDQKEGWLGAWIMSGDQLVASVALTPERVADTNWKIVASADLNRDGHADLIWQHLTEGWIAAWLMDGLTMKESVLLTPNRVSDPTWRIAGTGDFTGDGYPDLLWWSATEGWLVVWEMRDLKMTDSVALVPERVADVSWVPVVVADVNRDGRADIVWQHRRDGWLAAWLMNGRSLVSSVDFTPSRVSDTNWRIVGPK